MSLRKRLDAPMLVALTTHALDFPNNFQGLLTDSTNATIFLEMMVERNGGSNMKYYRGLSWFPQVLLDAYPVQSTGALTAMLRQHGNAVGGELKPKDKERMATSDAVWKKVLLLPGVLYTVLDNCPCLYDAVPYATRSPSPALTLRQVVACIMVFVRGALRAMQDAPPMSWEVYPTPLFVASTEGVYLSPQVTARDWVDIGKMFILWTRNLAMQTPDRQYTLVDFPALPRHAVAKYQQYTCLPPALHWRNTRVLEPDICRRWVSYMLDPAQVLFYLRFIMGDAVDARRFMQCGPRGRVEALRRLAMRLCHMTEVDASDHCAFVRLDRDAELQAYLQKYDHQQFLALPPLPDNWGEVLSVRLALEEFVELCITP